MSLPSIYFNSWSEKYRRPFGAVQAGKSVYFSIAVDLAKIWRVDLVIQKDGDSFQELEMFPSGEDARLYKLKFVTEKKSGLYFYHFKIDGDDGRSGRKTVFYGKAGDNFGGRGRIVYDPAVVEQYQITCYDHPDPAPCWYLHGVVYQIFVDRFNNGNRHHAVYSPKKNSFLYATEEDDPYYIRDKEGNITRWDFFGGNLKGITDKLPYLHALGVTVLYLSPIFEARSNHKYDTADYGKIDPMFGSKEAFQKLIAKAQGLGMHIILDGVFNHVGADSIYFNRFKTYEEGGAYNDTGSPYFDWFTFYHFPDDYDCWWNIKDLPAVDKNNTSYRNFIYQSDQSVIHRWTQTGIGGWRLDVADELPDDFIAGIRKALDSHSNKTERKVLIGEVWEDASNKIAYGKRRHYLEGGMLQGVMNYPFRLLIIGLLNQSTTAGQAVRASLTLKSNYPPEAFHANMNNIGTHDTERILTVLGGDENKLRLAVQLLMTLPGVPCVYYGDEAGLYGRKDPENRRFFPWGRENVNIQDIFRSAIQCRRSDENLRVGDYFPFSIRGLFGFIRFRSEEAYTVMIFNATPTRQTIDLEALDDQTGEGKIKPLVGSLLASGTALPPYSFLSGRKDR
ncbi:glycoside hydrolase family 13 protein [Sporolactobacillus sp. KGMB 08714]|uniref:glycoside hydrolase family 13 protein n=1 Tax=Sporolactobacillus sp. KGMB 08714 TaxID=3064704 RepID=UPI002FBDE679